MNVLVIGGGVFVGAALVDCALSRGHDVTVFNRGRSGTGIPANARHIVGDRYKALKLARGEWDVVFDVCAYNGAAVSIAARDLGSCKRYVLISTISVYSTFTAEITENSPLQAPSPSTDVYTDSTYGARKVYAEQMAAKYFPESLIVRVGMVVGRRDYIPRLAWWLRRASIATRAIVPGRPRRPIQLLDVRDLAMWCVTATESESSGVFNVVGESVSMERFIAAVRRVAGERCYFTWIPEDVLLRKGCTPAEYPYCAPEDQFGGMFRVSSERAQAVAPLHVTALEETIYDMYGWMQDGMLSQDPRVRDLLQSARNIGPPIELERDILNGWDRDHVKSTRELRGI